MASPPNFQPTAAELVILQQLWARGPLSVREIHEALDGDKPVVYTTVLKTMQIAFDRGLLTRESAGRKHVYTAAVEKHAIQENLLDGFLDRTFGGSTKGLVMRALGNGRASKQEIAELRTFLNQLDTEDDD
ncbi:BlaI/MecI/CopY family transcriptional regulator [Neolewinella antarctica]|uniref:Transcriptional regulator n=1 Tax=Neolewinella antarctica TaxID=442734 RepID=A0ABX0XAI2_9BACT|nr:BlaI/MecI/CopY family transcriptional regulator [Neolewinella antarctica]NJC25802.1 putative transcriptional regulator [Neolewinella antarctica]